MMRIRSYTPMAVSLALTGLLCLLLTPQIEAFASQMPAFFGRAVGFGLLGMAAVAIVCVFRSLPLAPAPARSRSTLRRDGEFRRGFVKGRGTSYRPRIEPRLDRE